NTFSISFSTSVFKQLPSGVYRIPIKYECMYLDSGELVGSSGYTITKEKEYQDIKTAMRVDPPNDLPYICVEVIDTNGIDMEVEALSTFTAGEQNAMLDVKIQNKEYYNLVDLEATLNANVGTPLKNPDNEYKYSLEPVEVGDLGKYGTSDVTIITFVTNIDKDAEGTYYVPIEIKGNDTHNNFVITKNLILKLVVNQRPPDFIVTSVSTTQIKPGKSFTLKVNAKNIGGSTANDVKATLVCSNNVLSPNSEGYLFMNTFIPGQERLIEFDIVASSSLELGITYNINMWLEYNDTKENVQTSTHSLSIKTSSIKSPSPAEVLVVTNMQTTEIRAGNSFTLTLNIRNAGDSDIKNAYVTFSSCTPFIYHNPAGTSTKPGTLNTGFIGVGNTSKAVFNMMVDPDVVQGNAYNCSIVITYMDSLDNQIYSPPYIKPIQLQVKYEGKTSLENRIDEIETEKSTLDMSLTLLAIIILIGIIFITVVFGAILRKRTKTESEKDSTPKPPSTPPVGPSNLPVIPPPKIVRQDTTQPPSKPTQDVFY
ncbi:MAG: hypothetical protein KAJ51_13160, partial [Thermoplasmata archaeon]|nr:hypothetical protein [Thermoplasmata archaeon]